MALSNLIPWRNKQRDLETRSALPTNVFDRMHWEMDRLFDRFMRDSSMPFDFGEAGGEWAPALDVSETDKEFTLRAEIPGVDPKELEITVTGDMLTLAGSKKETCEEKDRGGVVRSECRFGSFRRSLRLPTAVDADKVSAEINHGVLTVRLPKTEVANAKRITVKSN